MMSDPGQDAGINLFDKQPTLVTPGTMVSDEYVDIDVGTGTHAGTTHAGQPDSMSGPNSPMANTNIGTGKQATL